MRATPSAISLTLAILATTLSLTSCQSEDRLTSVQVVATNEAILAPTRRSKYVLDLFAKADVLAQQAVDDYTAVLYARAEHRFYQDLQRVVNRHYAGFADDLWTELDNNEWWLASQGAGVRTDYRTDADKDADWAAAELVSRAERALTGVSPTGSSVFGNSSVAAEAFYGTARITHSQSGNILPADYERAIDEFQGDWVAAREAILQRFCQTYSVPPTPAPDVVPAHMTANDWAFSVPKDWWMRCKR